MEAQAPEKKIGKFKASMIITKESWNLLKKDKEMMLFPIISSVVSFIAIGIVAIVFFLVSLGGDFENANPESSSYNVELVYVFAMYFLTFFITIFFQTGIIAIVHGRLNNQDLSFGDGMRKAFDKIGKIALWSLVAATVGVILKTISDRSKILGKIVIAILGAAWGILTFFIAPIIIIEDLSIKESLKKSASTIKSVWGETMIINIGVGFYFGMLFLAGIVIFIATLFTANAIIIITSAIVLFVYLVVLCVISSTLSVIFKVILYEYASSGKVPMGFSREVMDMAFKKK